MGDAQNGIDAYRAIYVNGHPNGSLMVRMAAAEEKQQTMEDAIKEIKQSIDQLPKKIFLWLSILATALVIFNFLAPSIKHALNMPEAANSQQYTLAR